jgi:23S rRNA (cytidine1920-2'-O)/16S rRNA (cytidine1409-2'-O)-methyltransferase
MDLQPKIFQKGYVIILKERLDVLLVNKGLFPSREKAKTSIMAGLIFVDGQLSDKAGNLVDTEANITIKDNLCPYVSRGGLKLEKSMALWNINLTDSICMDIGASTGGFTDCMLQNGASKIYAVDVGYGQLDYKLRNNPKVINMEKCNIRYVDKTTIEPLDFVSIDVSFISLKLVLPVASSLLKEDGKLVALIKPQFEAGREQIGKKGIVRDRNVHTQVVKNVIKYSLNCNLNPAGLTFSPVTGAKGNIEYLLFVDGKIKIKDTSILEDELAIEDIEKSLKIEEVVKASHEEFE